jgi:ketosteroid isomerase-like protein
MRKGISIIIFFLIIIGLTGGSSKSSAAQEPKAALKLTITQLIKYYEEEDVKEMRNLFSPGITVFLPDVPFRIEGLNSLMNELEQYFKENSRIKIALRQVDINIKDGVAIECGYYSTNSIYRNEPIAVHGRYTRLWEKNSEGNWVCFHEHMSYLPLP